MKKKSLSICVAALIAVFAVAGGLCYMQNYDKYYYTQIDNTKIRELPASSDMKYEYKLDCYSENGKKKELTFKTSRELREGAYLSLEVRSLGVHKWEEIDYNNLPVKVREKLK